MPSGARLPAVAVPPNMVGTLAHHASVPTMPLAPAYLHPVRAVEQSTLDHGLDGGSLRCPRQVGLCRLLLEPSGQIVFDHVTPVKLAIPTQAPSRFASVRLAFIRLATGAVQMGVKP